MSFITIKRVSFKLALVSLILLATAFGAYADHPSEWPPHNWFGTITSSLYDFEVHHIPNAWGVCSSLFSGANYTWCLQHLYPSTKALDAANALDDSRWQYDILGFPTELEVLGEPDRDVYFYNCNDVIFNPAFNCDNGKAAPGGIYMPAPNYISRSESCTRAVLLHELFHRIQYAYKGSEFCSSKWTQTVCEGQARLMQDRLFLDLDNNPAASCTATYLGDISDYLGTPNQNIWETGYDAVLWWNYLTEKYSHVYLSEPAYGIDFIQRWWFNAEDGNETNNDIPTITEDTIQEKTPNASLEGVFLNFAIANIAKDFNPSPFFSDHIQDLFWYVDDLGQGNYASINIPATQQGIISPDTIYQNNALVKPWGATYFEVDVDQCPTNNLIQLRIGHPILPPELAFIAMQPLGVGIIGINDDTNTVRAIYRKTQTYNGYTFTLGQPTFHYERVIAIVTGTNFDIGTSENGLVSLRFSCVPPMLTLPTIPDTLQFPTNPWAVPFNNSRPDLALTAQVDIAVTANGRLISGLDPDHFEVFVGDPNDETNRATVLQATPFETVYRLTLQVPQKDAGLYPVTIRLGGSEATKAEGIRYLDRYAFDRMLLLDQTASMQQPQTTSKFAAAKATANFFFDTASDQGQMGVIGYAAETQRQSGLSLQYLQLQNRIEPEAIDALNPTLGLISPVADALSLAADRFATDGQPNVLRQVVLINDGGEADPGGELAVWNDIRNDILAAGLQIHTIALGAGSDQALLQEIALTTGGQYHYVDVDLNAPEQMTIQLADIYGYIADKMEGRSRIWQATGLINRAETHTETFEVTNPLNSAVVSIFWSNAAEPPQIQLLRPDGSEVELGGVGSTDRQGAYHVVIPFDELESGAWQLNLTAGTQSTEFFAAVSGLVLGVDEFVSEQIDFGQGHDDAALAAQNGRFARGVPMPIKLNLIHDNLRGNGPAIMAIEHPDGVTQRLPLYDDGALRDAQADDRIYTGLYQRTTAASPAPFREGAEVRGSYNVQAEFAVSDQNGALQNIIAKGSFVLVEHEDETRDDVDRDRDGMPNRYEAEERCLDPERDDTTGDPDQDGLSSLDEYRLGASPCRADTDGSGEHDGSEHARGANPLDGEDDALRPPTFALVDDRLNEHEEVDEAHQLQPLTNLIRYPVNRNYDQIVLERSLTETGPFQVIAQFSARQHSGLYRDTNLQDGQAYFYRLKAIDPAGRESVYSPIFSGIAKADPIPPHGSVSIKGGATRTDSSQVVLLLDVLNENPSDTEVMIANNARFEGAVWQPFQSEVGWVLDAPQIKSQAGQTSSLSTVFVKFRDQAHNESHVYPVTFEVASPNSLAAIKGVVKLEGATDQAYTAVLVLDNPTIQSSITNGAGQFLLDKLPAGVYKLLFERSGYSNQTVEIEVLSGTTVDVGTVMLSQAASAYDVFLPIIIRAN